MTVKEMIEVDSNGEVRFNLFPKQAQFVNSDIDDILFGGAAGPGKTSAIQAFVALRRLQYPGTNGIIFRRTFRELEGSHILETKKLYTKLGARYNDNKKMWQFPNGSTQYFGYCEADGDVYHHQSAQYHDMCFDELTHFTFFQFSYLTTRCRSAIPGVKPLIRCASNPGNVGHCLPYGEVLTPDGWRDIRDFKVGDRVYTINKSGGMVETLVKQVHSSHYDGDMIEVNQSGFHMACTPNHSVAKTNGSRGRERGQRWSLAPFDKLPGQTTILRSVDWIGENADTFELPAHTENRKTKHSQPDSLPIHAYAQLMGWFISEGHVVDRDKAFAISQKKPHHRKTIESLLSLYGFKYRKNGCSFVIYSPKWWAYMRQFGKCREKFIPERLKRSSVEILSDLFLALVSGDGHWVRVGKSGAYYTISKRLADDFSEIAVKLGFIVRSVSRQRENRRGPCYEIFFSKRISRGTELLTGQHVYRVKTSTKRRSPIKRVPFCGPVYCLGISDTHAFVVRQQGSVWVSGNSWVFNRYVKPYETTKIWQDAQTGKTMTFIPARIMDNPALSEVDPTYIKRLGELKSTSEKKYLALAEGRWDVPEGTYFTEWNSTPGYSVLHYRRVPDTTTTKFLSMDWGFADPACVLWWEVTPMGRVFVYRELYTTRRSPKELAQDVLGMCPPSETYDYLTASPEIWGKRVETEGGGEPIADLMKTVFQDRLPMVKANNARIPGWLKVREYLSPAPGDGRPWLQVSPSCENLIRTVPAMIHDEKRPEDISAQCEDHCLESLRYGAVSLRDIPRAQINPFLSGYEKIFGTQEQAPKPMSAPAMPGRSGYGL